MFIRVSNFCLQNVQQKSRGSHELMKKFLLIPKQQDYDKVLQKI